MSYIVYYYYSFPQLPASQVRLIFHRLSLFFQIHYYVYWFDLSLVFLIMIRSLDFGSLLIQFLLLLMLTDSINLLTPYAKGKLLDSFRVFLPLPLIFLKYGFLVLIFTPSQVLASTFLHSTFHYH